MTFYEYVELVQDLRIRGSPHITYAKFSRLAKFIMFFILIFFCFWFLIDAMGSSEPVDTNSFSFFHVYMAGIYILVLGFIYYFQNSQEKQAVKKMRAYLASANPLLFNNKQLSWDIHKAGKYLALYLNYTGGSTQSATSNNLQPFNQASIEMYFQKNNSNIHNVSLDQSSQSIRQTIMSSYKYAY